MNLSCSDYGVSEVLAAGIAARGTSELEFGLVFAIFACVAGDPCWEQLGSGCLCSLGSRGGQHLRHADLSHSIRPGAIDLCPIFYRSSCVDQAIVVFGVVYLWSEALGIHHLPIAGLSWPWFLVNMHCLEPLLFAIYNRQSSPRRHHHSRPHPRVPSPTSVFPCFWPTSSIEALSHPFEYLLVNTKQRAVMGSLSAGLFGLASALVFKVPSYRAVEGLPVSPLLPFLPPHSSVILFSRNFRQSPP